MFLLLALLWDLKMDRKPKLAIAAIFCFSGIVVIFAIIRAIVVSPQTGHVDPVWLALWSIIEASVGEQHVRHPCRFSCGTNMTHAQPSLYLVSPPFESSNRAESRDGLAQITKVATLPLLPDPIIRVLLPRIEAILSPWTQYIKEDF